MTHPPAAKKPRLVGCSSFGSNKELSEVQLMRFKIHDFASLEQDRGKCIQLPPLKAHGYSWRINVYPRGNKKSNEQTEHISIYLKRACSNSTDVTVMYSIKCGACTQKQRQPKKFSSTYSWGWHNFEERETILDPEKDFLDEAGTLTVDVGLQIYREKNPVWFPREYQPGDIISRLWTSHECADVAFLIGDVKIPAHKFLLSANATTLFDLVKDSSGEEAIAINGVGVDVFKTILYYIYTGYLAKLDFIGGEIESKALLIAADRFGCTGLKLRVESEVTAHGLDKNNAAEWLLFADSHSCALLKEASVNLFIAHSETVMESAEWPMVKESPALLLELLEAQNLAKNISDDDRNNNIDHMDVSSLRERLDAAGLDVDGSREMLVSCLKNHVAENEEDNRDSDDGDTAE